MESQAELMTPESLPGWLRDWKPGGTLAMKEFFASRVVFYPGSGTDGQPVKFFGSRHVAHCFVYVDYGISRHHVEQELGESGHPFIGYRGIGHVHLTERDLTPEGWVPHLPLELSPNYRAIERPYAFLRILERKSGFDDGHGPQRLALLILCSDAIAAYDALWCQTGSQPTAPYAVVLQDHGWGGNYTTFGQGGRLEALASSTGRLPQVLFVAENTRPWSGYEPVEGEAEGGGGMHGFWRQIWRLKNPQWPHGSLPDVSVQHGTKINDTPKASMNSSDVEISLLPHYVYELIDPRTNEVFYIGKGSGDRVDAHARTADRDEENAKAARITDIRQSGSDVLGVIIGRFQTEGEAFAVESVLIKWVYGFDNLTNRVHGHRHQLIRPRAHKELGVYYAIEGIDMGRKIIGMRDGSYTDAQIEKIRDNLIFEKLASLRDDLRQIARFRSWSISDPDLQVPMDPCIIVKGFHDAVQLQIKMQLTGETVVLNLVPTDSTRSGVARFMDAITNIEEPWKPKKGSSRFGGRFTQTQDFVTSQGGYPRGILRSDVEVIARLSLVAVDRLSRQATKGPRA